MDLGTEDKRESKWTVAQLQRNIFWQLEKKLEKFRKKKNK